MIYETGLYEYFGGYTNIPTDIEEDHIGEDITLEEGSVVPLKTWVAETLPGLALKEKEEWGL